jgi:putative PIN family toxin of toxin-antitoxin system
MTIKVVIDTNVLLSALLFKNSLPFQAVKLAEEISLILYSQATLDELEKVLNRKKFDKYLSLEARKVFLLKFIHTAKLVMITEIVRVCRDEKDNKFLELAVSGEAKLIITGDVDLLSLKNFRRIEIINSDAFVQQYSSFR